MTNLTELANEFGSDKGTRIGDWGTAHGYTRIYERFLAPRRCEPLNLLEIGVWKGASLRMWEEFLPQARIVGVDILPDALQAASARSQVVIGDASNRDFLRHVVDTYFGGRVDVVVDDGSHVLDHQMAALETLFPLLSDGGLYFIEDISMSRFGVKGVGNRPFADFHDYAAWLAEQATFWDGSNPQQYHTIQNVNALTTTERDIVIPNYWNKWLDAVHFFYNICILDKRRRELPIADASLLPSVLSRSGGSKYALRALRERCGNVQSTSSRPSAPTPEFLAEMKDKLVNLEIEVRVATKLAQHSDSLPAAVNAAIECAQSQIGPFRASLEATEHEWSGMAAALARATVQAEQATKKLNHVEAEVELLRDRLGVLHPWKSLGDIAARDPEIGNRQPPHALVEAQSQIESLQVQLAALKTKADTAETQCVEAKARVETLEMELARGSTETAQIRLIHAGMWDSWQSAVAELERSTAKCRMLEQEIGDLRCHAAQRDTLVAQRDTLVAQRDTLVAQRDTLTTTVNELYASTSWRVAAPLRWLRRTLSRRQ